MVKKEVKEESKEESKSVLKRKIVQAIKPEVVKSKELTVDELKAKITSMLLPNRILEKGGFSHGISVTALHLKEMELIKPYVKKLRELGDGTKIGELRP